MKKCKVIRKNGKTIKRYFGVCYRDSHSLQYGWVEEEVEEIDWDEVYKKKCKKKGA